MLCLDALARCLGDAQNTAHFLPAQRTNQQVLVQVIDTGPPVEPMCCGKLDTVAAVETEPRKARHVDSSP